MRRAGDLVAEEVSPRPSVQTGRSCAAGFATPRGSTTRRAAARWAPASDPGSVVDSRFRVHRAGRLRMVDASVFPRIPGFFIATSVYILAEKANDVILQDAGS